MNDKPKTQIPVPETAFRILSIPLDQIIPSPHQARKMFDEDSIAILAESMKQEGLIQPITVKIASEERNAGAMEHVTSSLTPRNTDASTLLYELVSGERRFRAAKSLGWQTIPARIIQTIGPGETAAKGLIENLQREDLNPIEEAEGFHHLNKLSPDYWTQNQIAKVTGRTQGYVSQSIGLLKLAPEIQDNIRRRIFSRSLGLEIGRLDDISQQRRVVVDLGKNKTIKTVRNRVDKELGWKSRNGRNKPRPVPDPLENHWAEISEGDLASWKGTWGVKYDSQGSWSFHVYPTLSKESRESLSEWFKKMAEGLKDL